MKRLRSLLINIFIHKQTSIKPQFPDSDKLKDAEVFFARYRNHLGKGYDVEMCFPTLKGKCRYYETFTGEISKINSVPKLFL